MRIDSLSQIIKNKRTQRPKTYCQLVEKVGSEGSYQFKILLIFLLVWFFIGATLVNVIFLFQGSRFSCRQNGLLIQNCEEKVCQLPKEDRHKYLKRQKTQLKSMILDINDYYCDDQIYVTLSQLSFPIGILIGLIGFSYFSDNFGRRISILLSLGICSVGNIILSTSLNLLFASIGLFLIGIGSSSSLITTLFFFNQFSSNHKRQKYSVSVQLSLTFGTIVVTSSYYLIPHWRIISIILTTIPSLISFFLVFLYIEETPQFLLRKSFDEGLKSLNRIGNMNYKIKEILEQEDILAVKQNHVVSRQFNEIKVNHSSLMRFGSLKFKILDCCIISFATYFIYTWSGSMIGSFGFDIYSKNFIMQLTQLTVLIPVWIYVEKMKRKFVGLTVFLVTFFASVILMFLIVPVKCDTCEENTIKFFIIILIRGAIAAYLCIFTLYLNELFPMRVSGLGVGTASAFGSLGPLILKLLVENQNSNLLFFILCGLSFLGACLSTLLVQTKDQQIKVDVQEIQILKNKQRSLLSERNSFARGSVIKSFIKPEHNN